MKRLALFTLAVSCRKTTWLSFVRPPFTGAAVGLKLMSSGVSSVAGSTGGAAGSAGGSHMSQTQLVGEPGVEASADHPPPAQKIRLTENGISHHKTTAASQTRSEDENLVSAVASASGTGVCVAEEGATETSVSRGDPSATTSSNDTNPSGGAKAKVNRALGTTKKSEPQMEFTSINAPVRPKWFKWGTKTHNRRWRGLEGHLQKQEYFLKKFKAYAASGKWYRIHSLHYDWYLFPIEDGSKVEWQVAKGDVAVLRNSKEFMDRYRACVQCAAFGWGWDVEQRTKVSLPTAGWTRWDVRLAKIIRSLWLFEEKDLMESMQLFARSVKPHGGLSYGSCACSTLRDSIGQPFSCAFIFATNVVNTPRWNVSWNSLGHINLDEVYNMKL